MHKNVENKSRQKLPTSHCSLPTQYVELHARSAFSFLRGAATPEELMAVCSELKMPAMALLDNDGLYGAARFHLAGKKLDVKAHIGAEITVSDSKQKSRSQIPNSRFQIDDSRSQISNSRFQIDDSRSQMSNSRFQIHTPKLKTQSSTFT